MQGKLNGGAATQQPQQLQVNPVDAARFALTFLARAQFSAAERQAYDIAEAMLQAIAQGQLMLSENRPAPEPTATLAPELPPKPTED